MHDNQQAVFSLSNSLPPRESYKGGNKRPFVENHSNAIQDIKKPRKTNNGSTFASSAQRNRNIHELNSSHKDCSQDESNTNDTGIDTQNSQSDRGDDAEDNRTNRDKQGNTIDNADVARVIERIQCSKSLQKNELQSLLSEWSSLWERVDFQTSVQWHFTSIGDAIKKSPIRVAIHKWSLYKELEERMKQGGLCKSEKDYKDEMRQELLSLQTLTSAQRESRSHQFLLYLRHGAVFHRMLELCPATILLVAPYLTTREYDPTVH